MSTGTRKLSKLIGDLSHPDPNKKHLAAEALSEGDERAIYPLIKAMKDDNPGVQDAAMRSLICIGGEVTAYMVIPLLRDEPLLRNTAMIILKAIGKPAVPLLKPLLKDKDYDIRKFAIDLISEIKECDYAEELVTLLAEDPNPNVRAAAAKAISILDYREAIPRLIEALKDEEWVCFSVLEALAAMNDETSVDPIISLLERSDESIRYAAIETLGSMGSSASSKALLTLLERADAFEKAGIIKSLVRIGITPSTADVPDVLLDMLQNGDWNDQMIALKGLCDLGEERAISLIIDLAGSLEPSEPEDEEKLIFIKDILKNMECNDALIGTLHDPNIRYKGRKIAVEALGDLRCRKAVPQIIKLLENDFRDVRRAAAEALVEMSDTGEENTLIDAIDDEDGHVRKQALAALGKIGDKSSFRTILNLLPREHFQDVSEEFVKTLLALDAREMFSHLDEFNDTVKEAVSKYAVDADALLYLSRHSNPRIRSAAIVSLGRLQDEGTCQRISEALHDEEAEVRKAALIAMGEMNCCHDDIKTALDDTDMWVRVYAVKTLSHSLKQDTINSLKHMLGDKDIPVVLSTIDSIAQLGREDMLNLLTPLLEHSDDMVREKAREVIEGVQSNHYAEAEIWQ